MERAFTKVLVANRGEIAIRITRACQELGMATVAVYSDDDRKSFYYRIADEAVNISGSGARDTYLNIEKILQVAEKTGCDAVHPGYGFLSENPDFAGECERTGIKFIGPSSACMKKIGDKAGLKKLMKTGGIPTLPSLEDRVAAENLKTAIREIGLPVIIKPSFGGGGKGMRAVFTEQETEDAIRYARTIGKSAFGSPAFYIEKLLERPRHIEVQVLADHTGGILAFGERECSIQRDYQKLIEETPSPALTGEDRDIVIELARNAAGLIEYENAGTVEFLYQDGSFYFIEVNGRIQVEHSITELVTGIDLIKEQIRIAAGGSIPFAGEYIVPRGWAIQCRINAEDPSRNFLPSPGKILGYRAPGGFGVRVDTGVFMGYSIPAQYDSLVSKLSVWARGRDEAISRMKRVLNEYVILGTKTTLPLHRAIFREPDFLSGNFDTGYIEKHIGYLLETMRQLEQNERSHDQMLAEVFLNNLHGEHGSPESHVEVTPQAVAIPPFDPRNGDDNKRDGAELAALIGAAIALATNTESSSAEQIRETGRSGNSWSLAGRCAQMNQRLSGGTYRSGSKTHTAYGM
ncbi:MAG: ATP-grasp domain-containing protein [Candidatus Abyssobacteria bacterium SURF_5]|uniref:biotin carboxylase n=1 Tax=Abyssobacteria bacterium (strain SURF_5) TaxID=2093360 RepID=A0A3A4N9T3_ABYX5|nr:MAG: ATP-grasp domain-containing protein [Candidatus Abyssubacteria bacterium SURF_5]